MGLCPAGQKTTIEWQYPGEAKQRIEGADDYSITPNHSSRVLTDWHYDMGYSVLSSGIFNPSSPSQGRNGSLATLSRCSRAIENPQLQSTSSRIVAGFYAPIYRYRVSDFAKADYPCSAAALNYLPLLCTRPEGYRKVEIYAYKTPTSTSPEWIIGWIGTRNYLPGYMLQVPYGGEYPVVYNPTTNMYVGVIPSGYGWGYFNFVPTSNIARNSMSLQIWKGDLVVYQRTSTNIPTVTYFCGEQCPPGTCECTCGNKVCCYDPATGIAIKSFNK